MRKLITALLVSAGLALADAPSAIAIKDAKIVPVSGPVIPTGTVLLRNGLIEAVGANLPLPADAWVIDGKGLTVYPGLIDGLSTIGLPQPAPAATPARGNPMAAMAAQAANAPVIRGPEDRPATTSWIVAADQISPTEKRVETFRSAGYTTAVTFPTTGIFAGQGSVIDLAGEKAGQMVVASPIGQYITMRGAGGFGSFPGALFGVIAYVRQVYIDADYYKAAKKAYADNPRGSVRPEYDRALEGVLSSNRILLPASRAVEILRMSRFSAELKQPTILYGGHEAYRIAGEIKLPVLVNLKWPEKARESDPDEVETLRTLENRDPRSFVAGRTGQGRCEVRVLLGRHREAGRHPRRGEEGDRRRTLRRPGVAGDDAQRGRIVRRGRSPRLHREGQDRQPGGDQGRPVQQSAGAVRVRRRPEIRAGSRRARAGRSRTGRRQSPAHGRCGMRFVTAAFFALAATVWAAPPTVIQNATILTITKGTIKNGQVLIRDGKIVEVGEKVMIPSDAKIIDAGGQFLMPGIIDCHSHIATESVNEGSLSVSSMVGIEDVINPEEISIYRALAGGVTTVNVLHGSANAIGGKTVVIKTRWGKEAPELIFEGATPGIKFALGENPKRSGATPAAQGGRGRYPATRMGVEDVIREAFTEARTYQASWKEYNDKVKRGEKATPPRRDLKLEPLVEVLEGKRYVHAHCYRADEILMLLRVADDFGFKIRTLQHVLEGYKVAKEIAAHGAGASTFSDWWAYKMEAYDAIPYNAAIMTKKGVVVSLNSDDAELMRRLNTEAAKTVKYGGMTEEEALAMITINPAKQLAIDNRVGSIEVGKDADLVIFDKHPLSNYAKVQRVLIDGDTYFERDKDVSDRAAKEAKRKALIEKEKEQQRRNAPQRPQGAGERRPS